MNGNKQSIDGIVAFLTKGPLDAKTGLTFTQSFPWNRLSIQPGNEHEYVPTFYLKILFRSVTFKVSWTNDRYYEFKRVTINGSAFV